MGTSRTAVTRAAAEHGEVLAANARYLIEIAGRAPSVHNTQPWRFRVDEDVIELWADPRRKTWSDASGREMLISCGAALFGLRLAIRSLGYQPAVALLPDRNRLRLLARVGVGAPAAPNALEHAMLAAVPHRHTHRGPFEPRPLPPGLLPGLQDDAWVEGTRLALIPRGLPLERLTQLALAAARRGDLDPRARATIRRWTRAAGSGARDGIPAAALTADPATAAPTARAATAAPPNARPATRPGPGRLPQRDFDLGRHLGLLPLAGTEPAATAILLTRDDRRADWLHAGQALHRLLLHAASAWVFATLHTQPLEDPVTRTLIHSQLALPGSPQMILQLGHASAAASTPRRPVEDLTS